VVQNFSSELGDMVNKLLITKIYNVVLFTLNSRSRERTSCRHTKKMYLELIMETSLVDWRSLVPVLFAGDLSLNKVTAGVWCGNRIMKFHPN
jgi:hypothetical protein